MATSATTNAKTGEQQASSPGQQMTQSSQTQQRSLARNRDYPVVLAPGDFFRMNPFSLMRRMTEEMDRVLGEFGTNRADGGGARAAWMPAIEVSERDGKYVIRAELAGVNADDVTIQVTDDAVILQGERRTEHEETKRGVHLTERQYGLFYRAIPLPEGAKAEDVTATFENGVLEIVVPLEEKKSTSRQVPIDASSQPQSGSGNKPAGSENKSGTSDTSSSPGKAA